MYKSQAIYACKQITEISENLRDKNIKLENKFINTIIKKASHKKSFNQLDLEFLNDQLLELTQMSLEYGKKLRSIEDSQDILIENAEDYIEKIDEMKIYFPTHSIDFLRYFGVKTCNSFKHKVAKDLSYFQHRYRFLDTIADGFSNLIKEIERKREYTERENDRNQNITIFAAASGLGTAEVVGSNFKEIIEDKFVSTLPIINKEFIKNYPFVSVIVYSFAFSFFVGITLLWSWLSLKFAFKALLVVRNAIKIGDITIKEGKILMRRRRTKNDDSLIKEIKARIKYD